MSSVSAEGGGPEGLAALTQKIASGHIRTVSRCISLIENNDEEAAEIVAEADRLARSAMIVGVTGVPGAGKSTLVPALAQRFGARGYVPAILAVDPSSPLTGGAILGDRIRTPAAAAGIFFRSIASRGSLGGLSRTLDDVVTLLEAAGFDAIFIETVGTGQSEVAVSRLAHTTLLVTAPGLGDEIQAMKAGILETADIITVNKADTDGRGATATAETLRDALTLSQRFRGLSEGANPAKNGGAAAWLPPVRAVSALKGDGLDDLVVTVTQHRDFLAETGALEQRRRERRVERFREALRDRLLSRVVASNEERMRAAEAAVADRRSTPLRAATEIAQAVVRPEGQK